MTREKFHLCFGITLGCLAVVTIGLHIFMSSPTTTKLETTLFNIIEFGLSLGFAWFLAEYSTRMSFQESQRRFAVSAYRRISEIDIALDRLLSRLRHQIPRSTLDTQRELEVVFAMATAIRETIKLSIADWADIIGDELRTIKKITRIRDNKERLLEDALLTKPEHKRSDVPQESTLLDTLAEYQEEISRLVATLPPALQFASDEYGEEDDYEACRDELMAVLRDQGHVDLDGFWDSSFDKDIRAFEVSDILTVALSDVGSRIGALIATDPEDGARVGVITNRRRFGDYHDFAHGLVSCLRSSTFDVEITSIDPEESIGGRHYFCAKTVHLQAQENVSDGENTK